MLCSLPVFSHFPRYPQANWALLVLIPSGWACVHSRILWVSPMNCPVRLGVSPTAASTPTGVCSQRFEASFPRWSPGLRGLFCSHAVPPGLSMCECGAAGSASYHLVGSASCHLACPLPQPATSLGLPAASLPHVLSAPPTHLEECFFFISLGVGLPYSSIFCQFWLFFVFKFVVVLLLVVRGGIVRLPISHLGQKLFIFREK